ncbi:uncharacterized protein RAG0_10952 [Rhynchosporium agropyri]|uniref:Uncharacterized protein n=1 Tax=Rhynchosporium agropyri TaxID=914238 RepID=A0A1E1L4L0_9HELO|nr:uncharacterized protein RAG0_10952 [Rhynchosporium agropyri]
MEARVERLIYLGTLDGANGSIHSAFAVFKSYKGKGGYELRVRVLRGGLCGNVFPHDILGKLAYMSPLDAVKFERPFPATRDENIISAIKCTPRKKNALSSFFENSESGSNSDSDDDDFYDGTPIKRSVSHIRSKVYASFKKHSLQVIDRFFRGNLEARWLDVKDGVSSLEAIEFAFLKAAKKARRLMERKKFEVGQSKIRQSKNEQPTIRPLTFAEVKEEARRAMARDYTTYKAENEQRTSLNQRNSESAEETRRLMNEKKFADMQSEISVKRADRVSREHKRAQLAVEDRPQKISRLEDFMLGMCEVENAERISRDRKTPEAAKEAHGFVKMKTLEERVSELRKSRHEDSSYKKRKLSETARDENFCDNCVACRRGFC